MRMRGRRPDPDRADLANPTTPTDLWAAIAIVHHLGTPSVINWRDYDRMHNPPPLVDVWIHAAYRQVRL